MIFLWLDNVELAVARVKERVRAGGHDVAEDTIRRRYDRGLTNLFELYLPTADLWSVRDTSSNSSVEIARYTREEGSLIFKQGRWKQITL